MFISFVNSKTGEELFDKAQSLHLDSDEPNGYSLQVRTTDFEVSLYNTCSWDTIELWQSNECFTYKFNETTKKYEGPCFKYVKSTFSSNPIKPTIESYTRPELAQIMKWLIA